MIDILLASYNGEKFIAEQIESIIAQTYQNWRLIVCDDGSADKTAHIIEEYCEKYPERIKLYVNEKPTGSAKTNFFNMLKYIESDYVMFCDQDDCWLENKIEITLNEMKRQESENGNIPLLVHTDLIITDEKLNPLHASFFKYQGLDGGANTLNRLLVQNNATGCAMMINKKLSYIIKDGADDTDILMHDWWFALAACAFGKIVFINEATVLYRQHGKNQLGAVNNRSMAKALKIVINRSKTKKRVSVTYAQAHRFLQSYNDTLSAENKRIIEYYISIPRFNKFKRIYELIKRGHLKQNFLAAAGQLIYC